MAENKKSFILYCDLIHTVEKLPNEKAGELFKHILRYVNDKHPTTNDLLINISFEPIRQQFKRDLQKWEEKLEKRSEAGNISAGKRAFNKHLSDNCQIKLSKEDHINEAAYCIKKQRENYGTYMFYYYEEAIKYHKKMAAKSTSVEKIQQSSTKSTSVESTQQSSTNSTDNVNVNVNDNVNVINNIIPLEKKSREARLSKFDFIDELQKEFNTAYFNRFGFDYSNLSPKKERAALGKLLNLYKKNKGPKNDSKQTLFDLGVFFEKCMHVQDKWILDNISPSIIVSKFNTIKKIINGSTNNISKGATDEEVARVIAEHFGQ